MSINSCYYLYDLVFRFLIIVFHFTGQRYAMMLEKTMMAMMIRNFKISTAYKSIQEIDLECNLVMKPVNGYKISLEIR